jgi:hypothetical protein
MCDSNIPAIKDYNQLTNKEKRKEFIDQSRKVYSSMYQLLLIWEKLSSDDNMTTSIDNPFKESFDEFIHSYIGWLSKLETNFAKSDFNFSPTLTVGELKKILSTVNDDTQIVVDDEKNSWWLNIKTLELPDEDDGMFTLTFHTANDFDNRQF